MGLGIGGWGWVGGFRDRGVGLGIGGWGWVGLGIRKVEMGGFRSGDG